MNISEINLANDYQDYKSFSANDGRIAAAFGERGLELLHGLFVELHQYNLDHGTDIDLQIGRNGKTIEFVGLPEWVSRNSISEVVSRISGPVGLTFTIARNGQGNVVVYLTDQTFPGPALLDQQIEQLRSLANELRVAYPWQNIRQVRPLLLAFDQPAIDLEAAGLKPEEVLRLNSLVAELSELRKDILANPERAHFSQTGTSAFDLAQISAAKHPLDLINWAVPGGTQQLSTCLDGLRLCYPIAIDHAGRASVLAGMIDESPKMTFKASSTSKVEAEMRGEDGLAQKAVRRLFPGLSPLPGQRPFNFYIDAHKVDRNSSLPNLSRFASELRTAFGGQVANPTRIWIADFAGRYDEAGRCQLSPSYGDRYIDLVQHRPIFQYLAKYQDAYFDAADLLVQSYPEISRNTFATFLMVNTFVELFWMEAEDPWQDHGAADWFDLPQEDRFAQVYTSYLERGYAFGAKIKDPSDGREASYDLPWRIASLKVPIALQGLGSNAVIPGALMEAAGKGNGELWSKYFPGLPMSEEIIVGVAEDPIQSVKAVALMYDYILSQLLQTVLSDPAVRLPADTYPYLAEAPTARQYFLLSLARFTKAFPDFIDNYPSYFPYGFNSWNVDFIGDYFKLIQRIMGLEDSFPTLDMNFYPSRDLNIADYFGDASDPKTKDALMLVLTPR